VSRNREKPEMAEQPQGPNIDPSGRAPKKRRKKWPFILGGIILLIIVISIASSSGGSKSTTAAATSTAPAPTTASSAPPSSEYVDRQAHDAHGVVVSYQEVQGGLQILQQSSTDPATLASFQQLLSSAKDGFDQAENSFVLANGPKGTGSADKEAAAAIREFSDAMSSARSYVDSRKPSDLADFGQHWNQGKAWWNESVSKMWGAVNQPAPTV